MTDEDHIFNVKLSYRVVKIICVKAKSPQRAHKKAYNEFMDTPQDKIFEDSHLEDFFIETRIEGEDGSDMLHG